MSITKLTISELYKAVWQRPLKTLAESWHIDQQALSKLCDKHNIPRPHNGFWTQKSVGKNIPIKPLPGDLPASLLIDLSSLQVNKREKSKVQSCPLPPPRKSLGRYPLLKGIKQSLAKPRHKYDYIMTQQFDDTSALRLDVSSEQRDRAIDILHSLISVFDVNGWLVKVDRPRYEKRLTNIVIVDDIEIRFRLRERLKQKKRELTDKEKVEKERNSWVWKENILVPSGILQLTIDAPLPRGMKSLFEDNTKITLENQLGTFVENLRHSAEHSKGLEEERKIQEQKWKEERKRKEQHERAIKSEQERVRLFLGMFSKWQRANECREFINEVISSELVKELSPEELEHWKAWSHHVIDKLDPLINSDLRKLFNQDKDFDNSILREALNRLAE
ncbi:hypothetical protein [Pseudoalteromonas sp. P1-8]|uniref:hypothetical protein n=1 Tax=Pseudoalteromonas sp. P1-8 TaxID=1710353 RepID=UPI0006DC2036|nr:hypothetical protein [Pseudoalteromonas sp. P1-8]KPW01972.1 hypothetical protein AN213_01428 [Pseudoalteromonas sp. P1-8]